MMILEPGRLFKIVDQVETTVLLILLRLFSDPKVTMPVASQGNGATSGESLSGW